MTFMTDDELVEMLLAVSGNPSVGVASFKPDAALFLDDWVEL